MILNLARYFSRAMTGAYALNLLLFLPAHYMIGERWVFIAFFNSFAHLLILPSLLLLPLCLLLRQWRFSVALLPSVLFFALTWGSFFLPNNSVQAQASEQSLRILSYNMRSDGREPASFLELIRSTEADMVALQELGYPESLAIEASLSELYPFMALHPSYEPTQGQGILSRFPLSDDSYWQYDFLPNKLGHQRIIMNLDEDLFLTIYNLHPTHPGMNGQIFNPGYRSREVADILRRTSIEEGQVILLGDFNMTDLSDDYKAIANHYKDAFREGGLGTGWTFTMANSPAFLRLDYLFYSERIRVRSAEVRNDKGGSDHYPLLVELLLSKP
jgi:vancomycin resistance protein VanJ